jgi:hypothetical protein
VFELDGKAQFGTYAAKRRVYRPIPPSRPVQRDICSRASGPSTAQPICRKINFSKIDKPNLPTYFQT